MPTSSSGSHRSATSALVPTKLRRAETTVKSPLQTNRETLNPLIEVAVCAYGATFCAPAPLADLRSLEENPPSGSILRGVSGKPLNLDMLAREVILLAVRSPENYEPSAKRVAWHGYYAFRRGIATLASSVARDPMAAKGLLRHASVNTTLTHYVKDVPRVTENAMTLVEELFKPVGSYAKRFRFMTPLLQSLSSRYAWQNFQKAYEELTRTLAKYPPRCATLCGHPREYRRPLVAGGHVAGSLV